jgi:hypothetical protein
MKFSELPASVVAVVVQQEVTDLAVLPRLSHRCSPEVTTLVAVVVVQRERG